EQCCLVDVAVPGGIHGEARRELSRDDGQVAVGFKNDSPLLTARQRARLRPLRYYPWRRAGCQREGERHRRWGWREQGYAERIEKGEQVFLGHLVEPLDREFEQPCEHEGKHQPGVLE